MNGMYVDNEFKLILVLSRNSDKKTGEILDWYVQGVEWDAIIHKCGQKLKLEKETETIGFFDEVSGTILWEENYGAWSRLAYSEEQYKLLSYRPHVPLTMVAMAIFYNLVESFYRFWVHGLKFVWTKFFCEPRKQNVRDRLS